jgi:hypothetical protein
MNQPFPLDLVLTAISRTLKWLLEYQPPSTPATRVQFSYGEPRPMKPKEELKS